MDNKLATKVISVLLGPMAVWWAVGCAAGVKGQQAETAKPDAIDVILGRLNQQTKALRSYQSQIEYQFSQPLFESETVKKGDLYYQKPDGKSILRINFHTLKQDQEKEQTYIEQYIFDGIWLTHIDYQIRAVKRYQQAEPNEPVDVLDLAGRGLPIIGFGETDNLKREFEITLAGRCGGEDEDFIQLHLKVKPDSIYKNDYTFIDLWIDKEAYLPAKMAAASLEEDIYRIELIEPKINEGIDKGIFDFKIPEDFDKPQIVPLKRKDRIE